MRPFPVWAGHVILSESGLLLLGVWPAEGQVLTPGLSNDIGLVNAYTWEGGRGYKCDFSRSVGSIVPE